MKLAIALTAAALGALAVFTLRGETDSTGHHARAPSEHGARRAADRVRLSAPTSTNQARSSAGAVDETARPQTAPLGEREAPATALEPFLAQGAEFLRLLREHDAAEELDPAEDSETEAAQQAYEETVAQLRGELIEALRRNPDLAGVLLGQIDRLNDERAALALARVLRFSHEPKLLQEMARRATQGSTPLERRVAIVTLDGEDSDVWLEPLTAAFTSDPDATVQDEASRVLLHAVVDPRNLALRSKLEGTIEGQLTSHDPLARIRALRLFANLRARPEHLQRVQALLKDPDAEVRVEAERTIRLLNGKLSRR